jgi:MFS transporter, SHS family, lactate transporter
MATMVETAQTPLPWWKEPTRDQWRAWVAAWLGWTLDSFDFTIFLLIMLPIAQEFNVPLTDVTFVFTITLWMRLVGAVSSGWLGDRLGRRLPLMISILGYSLCNFIAGFSQPSGSYSCSAHSSASSWERNGRPAPPWLWSNGRSARAA